VRFSIIRSGEKSRSCRSILGAPPPGVKFDLNPKRFNTDDRTRIGLGSHVKILLCYITNIWQELFFQQSASVSETIPDIQNRLNRRGDAPSQQQQLANLTANRSNSVNIC
jgi:hypothetical protein